MTGPVIRHHQKGDAASVAVYSACTRYRTALTRIWDPSLRRIAFVLLNPSTATEVQNDPTVERCERRARALGYGGFRVANIFALRSTDPRALYADSDPVGPGNDAAIVEAALWSDLVLCGWGRHGALGDRGAQVAELLVRTGRPLWHLGQTKAGAPRHPLYVAYSQQPLRWQPIQAARSGSTST
jgi:hypothetical protein